MELSGLIFVALAVAWAAYLIPKALQHHDEVVRSRSVDRFSHRMRVLARREPVNGRNARLVVTPGRAAAPPVVVRKGPPAPMTRSHCQAVANATRRRRRVLGLILLATASVVGVAAFDIIGWWYVALPVGVLAAWLVTCRVMVRTERGLGRPSWIPVPVVDDEQTSAASYDAGSVLEDTMATPVVVDVPIDPESWDPLPVTLPTYVSKPAAGRRTVRTIDLDSTGVWSSGRSEVDSALAREADDADRAARARRRQDGDGSRAVGS
ncbi:MAG: divisome protein SepX/GlpR [Nocardioides sp.]